MGTLFAILQTVGTVHPIEGGGYVAGGAAALGVLAAVAARSLRRAPLR